MIEIKENEVYNTDGEESRFLGVIVGDVMHMNEDIPGRTRGQIRKAAHNPNLTFTVEAYAGKPISGSEDDEVKVPLPVVRPAGEANPWELTGFPPREHKDFKTAFINHYSASGWEAFLAHEGQK